MTRTTEPPDLSLGDSVPIRFSDQAPSFQFYDRDKNGLYEHLGHARGRGAPRGAEPLPHHASHRHQLTLVVYDDKLTARGGVLLRLRKNWHVARVQ